MQSLKDPKEEKVAAVRLLALSACEKATPIASIRTRVIVPAPRLPEALQGVLCGDRIHLLLQAVDATDEKGAVSSASSSLSCTPTLPSGASLTPSDEDGMSLESIAKEPLPKRPYKARATSGGAHPLLPSDAKGKWSFSEVKALRTFAYALTVKELQKMFLSRFTAEEITAKKQEMGLYDDSVRGKYKMSPVGRKRRRS